MIFLALRAFFVFIARGNDMTIQDIKLDDAERQTCEIWTRVMGYHRPVSEFNRGKKSEYYSRLCFSENKITPQLSDAQNLTGL